MKFESFYHTMDAWLQSLDSYSFDTLCTQPASGSWSLGQVYMHLFEETSYYIEQIKTCMLNDEDADKEMTNTAQIMLSNNEFPDERIEGPPTNAHITQPQSKQELVEKFFLMKKEMQAVEQLNTSHKFFGKTKHPGLGYFSAMDWLQFADMHLRHHLRQKRRIEQWLQQRNS